MCKFIPVKEYFNTYTRIQVHWDEVREPSPLTPLHAEDFLVLLAALDKHNFSS